MYNKFHNNQLKKIDSKIQERKEIIHKLFQILNINDKNNDFSLHKVDNDMVIINQIVNLEKKSKIILYVLIGPVLNKPK